MPLQKKKKPKKKPKSEKSKVVKDSVQQKQKVSQVVKINIGEMKPKPRRRAAPRKPPAARGGGLPPPPPGLAQQVQAPSMTQDVLAQSKELRGIIEKLRTSPAQQTLRGQERGGQSENALDPTTLMTRQEADERSQVNLQRGVEREAAIFGRMRDMERNFYEGLAVDMAAEADEESARRDDMSDLSSTTGSLAGFTMAETAKPSVHGLDPNIPEAQAVVMEGGAAETIREPPVVRGAGRPAGRGNYSAEERDAIVEAWARSGMSAREFQLSGQNPVGNAPIPVNTLNGFLRGRGGISGVRRDMGI